MTADGVLEPWPAWMCDSVERDYNETLAAAGLPAMDHLCESADEREVDRSCSPGFVAFVEGEVARLFA